jgi:LysM repeat protein
LFVSSLLQHRSSQQTEEGVEAMSVITMESLASPLSAPGSRDDRSAQRPRLALVPTGADAVGLTRTSPRPALRLTRRGRMLVAIFVALVIGVVTVVASGRFASAAVEARTVTVSAGQTLSEIAAATLPELAIADAIVEIQVANSLSTDQVHAGQTLRIPAG